jgi:hypothetical protein
LGVNHDFLEIEEAVDSLLRSSIARRGYQVPPEIVV